MSETLATVDVPTKHSRKALSTARSAAGLTTRVLRLRLKVKHAKALRALPSEVDFVWNYVNDLSYKVLRREHRFMSAYTSGATKSKRRVAALHAKIRNRRKDLLHKLSRQLINQYGAIFVGNLNAATLAKTPMAKSVLDVGWSMLRTMVSYKSDDAGGWYLEIDEAYSSQTCSACFARSGPRDLEGLGIREWVCSHCGAVHHRDTNSAQIILACGHARLAGGIPFFFA